ncbi:MAG: histidine--tRNA ligase [Candidatus Hecatellaceae archaeon]
MKERYKLPRGMKDIGPKEMGLRLWISDRILEVLNRYGFRLVEPSPIEGLETLEAKCGPSVRKEIYWFEDKAGRKLGLRFDLTVGLARMVASRRDIPLPAKLAALSNMWRYDEPQHGRYRCFYQWDAEVFGSPLPNADAEVIALSMDILDALKLENYEVRVSSRRLAEGFLNSLQIEKLESVEATLRVIDKFRKVSREKLAEEFYGLGLTRDTVEEIFGFMAIQDSPEKALKRLRELGVENEKFQRGISEVESALDVLKAMGKGERIILDASIVRGLGYYDGIVFEIYDRADLGLGALVGGGRFDRLCKLYGRDLPATGAAGGIERTILALEKSGVAGRFDQKPKVFVASAGEQAKIKVLEIVARLRGLGVSVEYDLKGRSLKGQLEYADSNGIPYVLIVGRKEIERGVVRLKDMEKRVEKELGFDECLKLLSRG